MGIHDVLTVVKNGKEMKMPVQAFTGGSGPAILASGVTIKEDGLDNSSGALINAVLLDEGVLEYANAVSKAINAKGGYVKPESNWLTGSSIARDFKEVVGKEYRAALLKRFTDNVEMTFTTENLNKLEAKFGETWRKALYNVSPSKPGAVQRMIGGRHAMQPSNAVGKWVNAAIMPIMFLNKRSGILQLISMFNFVNWSDNNPVKAAAAFANNKQFREDFKKILFSDKLTERRAGLKYSVEEAEFANKGGLDGKWDVFMAFATKIGFSVTQAADSFAIALGGASFYRNRVNTYLKAVNKDGSKTFTKAQAENKAWLDFSETADKSQQSSDQMLLTAEQTQGLGRIILAFSNTPGQYTRIITKAARDIGNRRGSDLSNLTKIAYYGALQNMLFGFVQGAGFATWDAFFGDDEERAKEEQKVYDDALAFYKGKTNKKTGNRTQSDKQAEKNAQKDLQAFKDAKQKFLDDKVTRVGKSMVDSVLRGAGVRGAALVAAYSTLVKFFEAEEKPMLKTSGVLEAAISFSPPMSAKARQLTGIMKSRRYNAGAREELGWNWKSPKWKELALITEFTTNAPAVWFAKQLDVARQVSGDDANLGQKAWLMGGWSAYDMGVEDSNYAAMEVRHKAEKAAKKAEEEAAKKAGEKLIEELRLSKRTPAEVARDLKAAKAKQKETNRKAANTRKKNKKKRNDSIMDAALQNVRKRRNQLNLQNNK